MAENCNLNEVADSVSNAHAIMDFAGNVVVVDVVRQSNSGLDAAGDGTDGSWDVLKDMHDALTNGAFDGVNGSVLDVVDFMAKVVEKSAVVVVVMRHSRD